MMTELYSLAGKKHAAFAVFLPFCLVIVTLRSRTERLFLCLAWLQKSSQIRCAFCRLRSITKILNFNNINKSLIRVIKGNGVFMKYSGFETDKTGKLFLCPICDNEEILNGHYCKICGFCLVNRCADTYFSHEDGIVEFRHSCGNNCDDNARYCHICGNEASYFQIKLLKPWNHHEELTGFESLSNSIDEDSLPFQ